jgi:hypothetical protein
MPAPREIPAGLRVTLVDHPLANFRLSTMRDMRTDNATFRLALRELTTGNPDHNTLRPQGCDGEIRRKGNSGRGMSLARRFVSPRRCSVAMSIWPGLGTAQDIDAKSFRCIREMTPVRQFYVDNLSGDLNATLVAANSSTGACAIRIDCAHPSADSASSHNASRPSLSSLPEISSIGHP